MAWSAEIIGPVETQRPNDRNVNPWYFTIYHLTRLIARVFFRFRVIRSERVIEDGPVILAMNHESYLDPPFAGIGLPARDLFSRPEDASRCSGARLDSAET